jgi:hypothetical protein
MRHDKGQSTAQCTSPISKCLSKNSTDETDSTDESDKMKSEEMLPLNAIEMGGQGLDDETLKLECVEDDVTMVEAKLECTVAG